MKKQDIEATKATIKKYKDLIAAAKKENWDYIDSRFGRISDCRFCGFYYYNRALEKRCVGCPVNILKDRYGCAHTSTYHRIRDAITLKSEKDFIKHAKTRVKELKNML